LISAVVKILIRGGSIAAGVGVSNGYAEILRIQYQPEGVHILNRAHAGDDSFDGVRTFQQEIEPYRPDILILHFGVDDAYLSVYRSEFKENLVQLVRKAGLCCHPIIMLLTSHTFDNPYEMETMNIYYRVIREVSVDLACEMIPIHTYWQGFLEEHGLRNGDLVQGDVRFPNERGHRVYAEAIGQRLRMILVARENSGADTPGKET
jgi:hypothetical protein